MSDITRKAVGELDSVASALRRAGSELGDQGGVAGKLVNAIANGVESAGRSLDGREVGDLLGDVERFARRNPATFIGGAIAVGFLASRFLKSSSSAIPEPAPQQIDAPMDVPLDVPMELEATPLDRPLIAGLAALTLGAIAGAIIHETDREHQLFGNARDRLARAARQRVADTVASVVTER